MTISILVIFGIAMLIFIFKDGMNKLHALISVLFGVYLANTGFGGVLQEWTNGFFQIISNLDF